MPAIDGVLLLALSGAPLWKGFPALGLAALAAIAASGRLKPWRPPPGTAWLAALLVWRAASALWSADPAESLFKSLRTGLLLPYVVLAGTAAPVDRARPVRALLLSTAAVALLGAAAALWGPEADGRTVNWPRPWPISEAGEFRGMLADHNQAGALFAFAGLVALGEPWVRGRRRATDAILTSLFGPVAVLLSRSRSALVALVAGLAAWGAASGRRAFGAAAGLLLALGAAAIALPPTRAALLDLSAPRAGGSVHERWLHWAAAAAVVADRPVLGVGYHALQAHYARAVLPGVRPGATGPASLHHAHNEYLTVAAETGIVGLALHLGFWLAVLRGLLRGGPAARTAGAALFGLLAGDVFERNLAVEGVLLPVAYVIGLAARRDPLENLQGPADRTRR